MNGEFVKGAALAIACILPIEAGEVNVPRENLAQAVFGVTPSRVAAGVKQKIIESMDA